ncbi:MAG: LytTR family DNA-binding domain-containing protein [Rhodosalinus sp.]
MNDEPRSSALRELRGDLARPRTLALLAGIAGVLTLMGPFGTDTLLRPLPRLVYWAGVVGPTFATGFLSHILVRRRLGGRVGALGLAVLGAVLTALSVSALVVALNAAVFGTLPGPREAPGVLLTMGGIAVIVSLVFSAVHHETGEEASPGAPPLLDRLPPEKRGPLVSLSVEDHYVRVRTTCGEEMLLMRLSDAIRETRPVRGMQVHRSHWVALDRIAAVRRTGDRVRLGMSHGPEVPVSRANLPALREAGLLPR